MTNTEHTFHIPVMGTGYTLTSPIKVAQYGINSVVSLVDDILMEKMRKHLCKMYYIDYKEISSKDIDHRAKRITNYLNLLNDIVNRQITKLKSEPFLKNTSVSKYFKLLPDNSSLKKKYQQMRDTINAFKQVELQDELKKHLLPGSIDVNIMTKLDKPNFVNKKEKLGQEYNDAHAALRGYANSNLRSSIVLSAGLNPRLYSYMEEFDDFYPDENGEIKKQVVLKVSDYRSALIQGKFLAKKGIWVSEFRIESGLNCGGHAFATDGYLMGPILEEFHQNRSTLSDTLFEIYEKVLIGKDKIVPSEVPEMRLSAQGGVGTPEEHNFLLQNYDLNSVGWGTPFLFVPEAVEIDQNTLDLLCQAKENDFYTSNISPLGVLFNSVKGNTKDEEKQINIKKNRPGSSCPKKFASLNTEFTDEPICTASREYQFKKINDLKSSDLPKDQLQREIDKVMEKSCICVGLGTSALLNNELDTKAEGHGVSICPGPNGAYFSKSISLHQMIDYIYGRTESIVGSGRPDFFAKELQMYVSHYKEKMRSGEIQGRKLESFKANLQHGIEYYEQLLKDIPLDSQDVFKSLKEEIEDSIPV